MRGVESITDNLFHLVYYFDNFGIVKGFVEISLGSLQGNARCREVILWSAAGSLGRSQAKAPYRSESPG